MTLVAFRSKENVHASYSCNSAFVLYAAFVITQIELLRLCFDGVTGHHRALEVR